MALREHQPINLQIGSADMDRKQGGSNELCLLIVAWAMRCDRSIVEISYLVMSSYILSLVILTSKVYIYYTPGP